MADTSQGIMFAIRLYEQGEDKVARQLARLDQKLKLLRGTNATVSGFYSSSVFGKKFYDKFYGKGSQSFRSKIRRCMLDVAVEIVIDLISLSRGTTGNMASSWHIAIERNDVEYGKFYNKSADYMKAHKIARRSETMFHKNVNEAKQREVWASEKDDNLLPTHKNRYTIYISNYAYVSNEGIVGRYVFDGYYARKMYEDSSLGRYNKGGSITDLDAWVQNTYKERFNSKVKNLLREK